MSKKQIIFVVLAALWFIFVGIYVGTSSGEEQPKYDHPLASGQDWVDIVGEHIGGWEQPLTIDVRMDYGKMRVSIGLEDGSCYEYFILLKESGHEVFYRDCGEKSYDRLN